MRGVVVAAALAAMTATAHADRVPPGRMAAMIGIGTKSDVGFIYGGQAAWEPFPDGRHVGYGLVWDVLFSDYGQDPASITGSLQLLQMNLGARLRIAIGDTSRSVFLGGGGALLRASSPLPPSMQRSYLGGYVSGGLELLAPHGALLTIEGRWDVIGHAPLAPSVLLGVGFGV